MRRRGSPLLTFLAAGGRPASSRGCGRHDVGRSLALTALLALAACGPKVAEVRGSQPFVLDCSQGFETLKAKVAALPDTRPAPKETGEPYSFYSREDGSASWLLTEPGAPGHPAILMQIAAAGGVTTTGCPYGDSAGYGQLVAYLDSLKQTRGE